MYFIDIQAILLLGQAGMSSIDHDQTPQNAALFFTNPAVQGH